MQFNTFGHFKEQNRREVKRLLRRYAPRNDELYMFYSKHFVLFCIKFSLYMLNNLLTKTVVDPSLGFRHCESQHVIASGAKQSKCKFTLVVLSNKRVRGQEIASSLCSSQ
jgi:hypothetical protein